MSRSKGSGRWSYLCGGRPSCAWVAGPAGRAPGCRGYRWCCRRRLSARRRGGRRGRARWRTRDPAPASPPRCPAPPRSVAAAETPVAAAAVGAGARASPSQLPCCGRSCGTKQAPVTRIEFYFTERGLLLSWLMAPITQRRVCTCASTCWLPVGRGVDKMRDEGADVHTCATPARFKRRANYAQSGGQRPFPVPTARPSLNKSLITVVFDEN